MVELREREIEHVEYFYNESKDKELRELFPFQDNSLDEAIKLFYESKMERARSYGKVIYFDGIYVGDVWCYVMDESKKTCFFSIVIFNKDIWGKGIGFLSGGAFIEEVKEQYGMKTINAFSFKKNIGSIKLMQKLGFVEIEEFEENGVKSIYFERRL